MRFLVVHPGADYATSDFYDGLVPAFEAKGITCAPYALSNRIAVAASWLATAWQMNGRTLGVQPTDADVSYQASIGALERALRLQVDWVFVFSAMFFHPDCLVLMRRAGLKIAVLLTESPYQDEGEQRLLKWVDIAWTNERTCVEPYRQVNPNVFYLPHAYDPSRHLPAADGADEDDVAAHDVVFVGTPFPERVELLEAIDWTGVDLGVYGLWDDSLRADSPLRKYLHEGIVPNATAAALYRRARIGLNLYRTSRDFEGGQHAAGAESLNPRALELAACECFQISNWRAEVDEVFGESVVTFSNARHLEAQLRDALSDPALRRVYAASAREAARDRTFERRAEQVLAELANVTSSHLSVA